ncbi:zinc-finger domain-containing protein [Rhodovulum euryhalinum]|uniref:Putative Zn-finger protein n=1 Tax=Rhodovulum euryhalinum TaxID=35805 RepID=A0A4R2KT35_9RHOB|nr:zinc-finger domain-containing protein [Rhodovulum euryhalinum]TCO74226.1 putative Zn-finger protein [Rhodovulum euryhalinum]
MTPEAPEDPKAIDAPETEIVSQWRVACDGSGPALGHPRVWLQIPRDVGYVDCGYCDKRFIHESAADKVT